MRSSRQTVGSIVACCGMAMAAMASASLAQEQDVDRGELLKSFRREFIKISPGDDRFPNQARLHESGSTTLQLVQPRIVELNQSFEIGKYEVTQELWQSVMGANPSRWKGARNSVENLSFDEAIDFCQRVTTQLRAAKLIDDDQLIRLPTEVEWEYVCRAGSDTKFSFGDSIESLDDYAWHTGNAAGNDPPVGAKKPNPWGLYDVHGYLWEWCLSDVLMPDQLTSPTAQDWQESASADRAALRGGSWKDPAAQLASGFRRIAGRDLHDDAVGLRCVLISSTPAIEREADRFEPTAQERFVPADAQLELLWDQGEFTEGPAAAPDGLIYFSDIGNRIMRFDPRSRRVELFREPSGRANGLAFDADGRLVVCEGANTGGRRRISVTDEQGQVTTLAERLGGLRFNSPNDLVFDKDGNLYFSDPRYVGDEPRELDFEAVIRVTPDGNTSVATRDVTKPNGLLISPDGRTAYVAEHHPTGDKMLLAFRIDAKGAFTDRRVLFDFGSSRGIDGMTMDGKGNVYATAGSGDEAGIYIFSPTGIAMALIKLPGDPTNCCFGSGEEATTLYITAAIHESGAENEPPRYGLYRIKL